MSDETQSSNPITTSIDSETLIIYNLIIQMQINYTERLSSSEFDNIIEDRMKTDLQCSIIREEMDKIKEQLGRDVTKYEILLANNYYHSITTFVSKEPIPDETITHETITDETIPDETIPDETITDETITDETITDETIVDETIVDETITDETIPDETIVDETIPDE